MSDSRRVQLKDVAEMLMGAIPLAYPLCATEEVWKLGESISWWSTLSLWLGSALVIGWYGTHAFQDGSFRHNAGRVVWRVSVVQMLTFAACATLLAFFGKFPVLTEPLVAIKRTIIVMFPAAFSATIVDSLAFESSRPESGDTTRAG